MTILVIVISAIVTLGAAASVAGVIYAWRHDDERKWAK